MGSNIAGELNKVPHMREWDVLKGKRKETGVNGIITSPIPCVGTGKIDATYTDKFGITKYSRELATWAGSVEIALVWGKELVLKESLNV